MNAHNSDNRPSLPLPTGAEGPSRLPDEALRHGHLSSRFRSALTLLGLEDPRQAQRHPCLHPARFRGVRLARDRSWPATVVDVSVSGVGFLSTRPLEPGSVLVLEVAPQALTVSVRHAEPAGGGSWRIGGTWLHPLNTDQQELFLTVPDSLA